ncbi:MAG: hypothetical protein NTV54_02320 [Ignavibacteriales bacterium]|nr:hypothetical protein [Ignavibacteriales bacterium]
MIKEFLAAPGRNFFIAILFVIPGAMQALASPGDSTYFSFPASRGANRMSFDIGMSLTLLPRSVVEEEIRQIPMIDFRARWDFSRHFVLTGRISTIYIANQCALGIWWMGRVGPVAFAAGDEVAYWYGTADMEGFNTAAMGLLTYPAVSMGLLVDDVFISVKETALISISQHTYVGDVNIGRIKPSVTGVATTLALEQPLWKHHMIATRLTLNYARPQYQTWLAFTPASTWLMMPEFSFSYIW